MHRTAIVCGIESFLLPLGKDSTGTTSRAGTAEAESVQYL
ncbi:hypothetical protein HMPREF0083_02484 [Aneurinibacillus aneurinilyticus ATCC 12856]|uniref:Uncharacterized protein n=1 Tax=Aneurinibacillus aneurinilyticus ATCC 12856 TaxID=649747 RepID=U1X4H0_ANEAE|nr:hypothetical protein HMPREF0083_02484 [Aneurinibacillus aneurinilyticus ATCC 12856]